MWWKFFAPLSCLLFVATVNCQNGQNGQSIADINRRSEIQEACSNLARSRATVLGGNYGNILNDCILRNLGFTHPQRPQTPSLGQVEVHYTQVSVIHPTIATRGSDGSTITTNQLRPKQPGAAFNGGAIYDGGNGGNGGGSGGGGGGSGGGNGGNGGGSGGGGGGSGGGGGGGGGNGGNGGDGGNNSNAGGKRGTFSQDGGNGINGVDGYSIPVAGLSGPRVSAASGPVAPIATTIRYGGETDTIPNRSAPISTQKFTNNLYQLIAPNNKYQNVVYSPISLEILMALTYIGARGQTANEIQTALDLPNNKQSVLQQYRSLTKSTRNAAYQLDMANKLYYNQDLILKPDFKANAKEYFDAETEHVRFEDAYQTAQKINQWVLHQTHGRIQNLIQAETLEPQTSAILINAIYFKALWEKEFSTGDTEDDHFITTDRLKVPVAMMNNEDVFYYLDMPSIGASVLRLPYKDSDLSMLIILPKDIDGLAAVEAKMRNLDLRQLSQQMQPETVKVQIPKFRVEFEMDMIPALRALQIQRLFSDSAELNDIFRDQQAGISKVQHKAFLDVNEAGSEAAAATFNKLTPLSLPTNLKTFRADHPFMFAIVSPQAVYFMGHVVNF